MDQAALVAENARLREELDLIRRRLVQLESDVRAQVARDLHDGPVQQVAAAGLHLSYLRRVFDRAPAMAPEVIDDLDDQLARVMRLLRTTLYELRPLGLQEHGLVWVVEQYAEKLRGMDGPDVRLEVRSQPRRLPPTNEAAGFLIVQEAIMNARKHAAATVVLVSFSEEEARLRIDVVDDGRGFDLAATEARYSAASSLGLLSMRERAELVGGSMNIASTPGAGTTVSIWLPFEAG